MKTAKKLLLASTLFMALGSVGIKQADAASATVDASVATRTAVAVVKNTDMSFGRIDVIIGTQDQTVTLAPTGNGVTITGGTAGTVSDGGGTKTSGKVTLTTDGSTAVDVTCNTTTALGNGSGDTLTLGTITLEGITGTAFTTHACDGTATSITPTAATTELGIGAALVLDTTTNNVAAGTFTYSTSTGGTPLTVTAVYP